MKETFKVALASTKSCLVNLPSVLARSLALKNVPAQGIVVVISLGSTKSYAGWTGHGASDSKAVEMDAAFARNIGAAVGNDVSLDIQYDPPRAEVVWVEPNTADDWEIMELHASFLELNLLNQIRAVSTAHPLTVYLNAHTTATILVKRIEPDLVDGQMFARISPSAEVIVSPKSRPVNNKESVSVRSNGSTKARTTRSTKRQTSVFLRALPDSTSKLTGLNIFVPASVLRSALGISKYLQVQVVLPSALQSKSDNDLIQPPTPPKDFKEDSALTVAREIVVRAHGVEDVPEGHVRLSEKVMLAIGAEVGSKIRLSLAPQPKKVSKITCHCILAESRKKEIKIGGKQTTEVIDVFKRLLSDIGEGPMTHGLRLDNFLLGLGGPGEWSTVAAIDKLSFTQGEDVVSTNKMPSAFPACPIKGVDVVKAKVQKVLSRSGGVLIFGSRGSGKSLMLSSCALDAQDRFRHVVVAECAKLAEERVPGIKEALRKWFTLAAWYEPSIIVMDDLDRMCPAEVEHADSTRARQIAEIFLSILRQFTARHSIAILATAQSKEALHSLLTTSHIFDETIGLKPPDKAARREIAQSLVASENTGEVDWLEVANVTDGYLAGDLRFLTDRAKSEALMREMNESRLSAPAAAATSSSSLQTIDYLNAIKDFTPASLRGIKLQKSSVEWKDIGGLTETRQILLETLEWPTRYAPIFANCPLRLRSGLLLYGYPGCGKTLLASAVASECGLNFISVKGPEILNKYIGASEKSVRDLFDRAQAAKPCVLFFDEFDSIAPKRGHDSTGVTDRVVNQMLTQMDGAEGLDGVYVLAATSRPDLIDPALLRPGRLDKSLLCNMPTASDRHSILTALSRKMHVADTVDLSDLASRTEGFTGADLQAVLYNAHLEAVHDLITQQEQDLAASSSELGSQKGAQKVPTTFTQFKLSEKGKENGLVPKTSAERAAVNARIEEILSNAALARSLKSSDRVASPKVEQVIAISLENLTKSLDSTKPSISHDERRRLDKVYHDFVDGRSADGLPDGQAASGEQRATLA